MGRKLKYLIIFIGVLLILNLVYGQQAINGSRYILGYWDASQARWTKPFMVSASQPATCAVGEVMFDTNATAGQNIYLCTATDTWTQVTGGPGGSGDMTKAVYDTDDDGTVDLAAIAAALAADPSACSAGEFVTDIAADGSLTCDTPPAGGGTPAGSIGNVQYNADGTSFGAEAALTYDNTTNILTLGKLKISDTCTLGATTTLAAGTLCWSTSNGLLGSDGANWWTGMWLDTAGGEVLYSGLNYNPTAEAGFSYNSLTNILTVPSIVHTTSIRGSSNTISLDPDADGTIESSFDGTGNFSGKAATAGALSADGTNCSAGEAALGVDEAGNAQGCWTPTSTPQNLWKTFDTPSGTDLVADNTADTLILAAGTGISISGDGTNTMTITNTAPESAQNIWSTVDVDGTGDVVPDSTADTLTITAGTGISISGNATSDTITVASTVTDTGDELTVNGTSVTSPNLLTNSDITFSLATSNITGVVNNDSHTHDASGPLGRSRFTMPTNYDGDNDGTADASTWWGSTGKVCVYDTANNNSAIVWSAKYNVWIGIKNGATANHGYIIKPDVDAAGDGTCDVVSTFDFPNYGGTNLDSEGVTVTDPYSDYFYISTEQTGASNYEYLMEYSIQDAIAGGNLTQTKIWQIPDAWCNSSNGWEAIAFVPDRRYGPTNWTRIPKGYFIGICQGVSNSIYKFTVDTDGSGTAQTPSSVAGPLNDPCGLTYSTGNDINYDWETGLLWASAASEIAWFDTDLNCLGKVAVPSGTGDYEGMALGNGKLVLGDDGAGTWTVYDFPRTQFDPTVASPARQLVMRKTCDQTVDGELCWDYDADTLHIGTNAATGLLGGNIGNDYVLVGDGTSQAALLLPDCDADNQTLSYDQATNAWACGDDDTGAGGGDEVTVDGTATTNPDFADGGDINFAYSTGTVTATVKADSVALGTDTTGNYAAANAEAGVATSAAALDSDSDGTNELYKSNSGIRVDASEDGTYNIVLTDGSAGDSIWGRIFGRNVAGSNADTGLSFYNNGTSAAAVLPYTDGTISTTDLGSTTVAWNHIYATEFRFPAGGGSLASNGFSTADSLFQITADSDNDGTGEGFKVDATGDGTFEFYLDGTLTDCDNATTSKVLWDATTAKLSCGTDQTGEASQNIWSTIDVDGTGDVAPDSTADTLTITAGTGITISGTAASDTITITNSSPASGISQVDIDGDGTREISLATSALAIDPDENGTAELTIDASGNFFRWDINNDGTTEFTYDADLGAAPYFCMDPDDNGNCDFKFIDVGTDATPQVGISFHDAANPTILHDENAKTIHFDYDEDGTYDLSLDGSAVQITLDPNSDGTTDMLLNQTFLQTDQIRYSSTSAARMTASNGRMHMCGGNQFAPNVAAGACMSLGGSTGGYASAIYFDPDGDGTDETNINSSGVYSGQATTAGALATDPSGCSAGQVVTDIAAAGALTCNSITGSYITDGTILMADLTWDSTATRIAGQSILVGTDTTKFIAGTPAAASALAADPSDCSANQFANAIAASGNLTCAAIADADVPNTITIDRATSAAKIDSDNDGTAEVGHATSTISFDPDDDGTAESTIDGTGNFSGKAGSATALAADPTDCSANQFAQSIVASGNLTCAAIADADVPDTITASNYLPLAGGTLTGNLALSGDASEGLSGGGLTDCDNSTTSKLLWDSTTNKFSCGTDQTSGASTQVDIDGDGTREISLASSVMSIDPDEDGTAEVSVDSSANKLTVDPDANGTANLVVGTDVPAHNEVYTWDGTNSVAIWATAGAASGDVTDVYGCASGDCNDISVADGEQLDFSSVNNSATTEGLVLPQGTSVLTGTATGQIGFDTTDGRGAVYVGQQVNGLALAVPINVQSPEYVYMFSDFISSTTSSSVSPFSSTEGTFSVPVTADADPESSSSGFGHIGMVTGTTAGNEAMIGASAYANTSTQTFEPRKMRLFGVRGQNYLAAYTKTRKMAVGGLRESSDGNPYTKTDGIFFWCDQAADLDNDGTVGDADSDGTGTTHPDGDCADAGEDADDCKWYAVTMNGSTDNASGIISQSTNTTATKTTVDCSAGTTTFQTLEMAYNGTTVEFYINGASAATHTTNIPAAGNRMALWGVRVDQNMAATIGYVVDWMRYYGVR